MSLLVGLLGMGLAVALPLAPVVADRTVVSWPTEGALPTSTTAFFVPYRPAEVHAQVPCRSVLEALDAPERTTLLATTRVRGDGPTSGLVVDTEAGQLRVLVNGRLVHTASPAGTGCDVRVDSDDTGTTVAVGADAPTVLSGEPVPEVFAFTTDLTPEEAEGTTVTARTRTWFESRPSGVKAAMIGAHVVLVVLSVTLLAWRRGERPAPTRRTEQRERVRGRGVRAACDAAVVAALSVWVVIAPHTVDDSYATMTIRNGIESGDIGNYYRWYNASEAPFTLVQHLLQPLAMITTEPVWLRLPSYLAGIATWFLVSLGVLGVTLPQSGRGRLARVLAALCFLAWWLPYNTGVRPEPFVALAVVGVFALLLRATAPTARRPLLLLAAAALVAGLSLSITPSGILVFAPVLVLLPRIWRTLRTTDGEAPHAAWATVAGRAALLACLASAGLVVMFADQSWHGAAKATEMHTVIGPNFSWYEEIGRYARLLQYGGEGTATKRLPVLLTLGMLLIVALLIARRVRALQGFGEAHVLAGTAALAFALLWATPSKWSHHFGSLAGLCAPFLVLAGLLLLQVVRDRSRDGAVRVIGLAGTGVLAGAAGLAFSGPNDWWLYSDHGVSYLGLPVRPFGVPIDNPATWLVLGLAAAAVVAWSRSRDTRGLGGSAVVLSPVLITAGACVVSLAVLLGGFAVAALRQAEVGGYTVAATNLASLTGSSCGMAESIQVFPDDPEGPLRPATGDGSDDGSAVGFRRDAGHLSPPPAELAGSGSALDSWGSFVDGERSTGELTSPWYSLPDLTAGQDVAVSAAGRTGGANRLELEFGRSDGDGGVDTLAASRLDDGPAGFVHWRPLAVTADAVPDTADRVRVVAADASTDVGGWLAVTGPRVRTAQSLQDWLAGQGPVLPDWLVGNHVPCVQDVPVVSDGLAETPAIVLAHPNGVNSSVPSFNPAGTGTFAGVAVADQEVVPSWLPGSHLPVWGHVVRLDYPFDRDRYDRVTDQVTLWGWEGDR
ncbi:arabinosyltransferase domain-containing protein [Geodermatophilus sp. URMC 61]|uniref:arabinosyltransferase domain-containing protein n=1 Tax=Geodermatophilus sp. URMC 61 TaxID=3423411 RepID=UPI00406CF0B9